MANQTPTVMARNEAISELCKSGNGYNVVKYIPHVFIILLCLLASVSAFAQSTDTIRKDTSVPTHKTNPLIVKDGVPYKGDIKSIDPKTIADITVLKGNDATSLYGTEASNGAILIRTKQHNPSPDTARMAMHQQNGDFSKNKPLVILDGKEYKKNLNTINPDKIESVTVLKSKNATDKYGSKGANGVLEITTKK